METTDILLGVTLPPLATILQYYKEQAAFSSPSPLELETAKPTKHRIHQ